MQGARRTRSRSRLAALFCAIAATMSLTFAGSAFALQDYIDGNQYPHVICGSPSGSCYGQTTGAHTFYLMTGASNYGGTALTCQLLRSGWSSEQHGSGSCSRSYSGSEYNWGRVYNKASWSDYLLGFGTA